MVFELFLDLKGEVSLSRDVRRQGAETRKQEGGWDAGTRGDKQSWGSRGSRMGHEVDQQEGAISGTLDFRSGGSGTHCRILSWDENVLFFFHHTCCFLLRLGKEAFLNLIFILHWNVVDLQCCDSFRCTAKISYAYTYISSFFQTLSPTGSYRILSSLSLLIIFYSVVHIC